MISSHRNPLHAAHLLGPTSPRTLARAFPPHDLADSTPDPLRHGDGEGRKEEDPLIVLGTGELCCTSPRSGHHPPGLIVLPPLPPYLPYFWPCCSTSEDPRDAAYLDPLPCSLAPTISGFVHLPPSTTFGSGYFELEGVGGSGPDDHHHGGSGPLVVLPCTLSSQKARIGLLVVVSCAE